MLDHTQCPEFAGPLDERQAAGGGAAFDIQALHQGTVRLPRLNPDALAAGEYVPLQGPNPFLPDPAMMARERAELYHRDLLRIQLRDAALGAAKDALLGDTLTAQIAGDVDGWAEVAVRQATAPPAGVAEPAEAPPAEAEVSDPPPAPAATEAADVVNVRPRKQPKENS